MPFSDPHALMPQENRDTLDRHAGASLEGYHGNSKLLHYPKSGSQGLLFIAMSNFSISTKNAGI